MTSDTREKGQRSGDFLAGKYLLEDLLGVGGMGEVYRATNISLGRKVAIKLLSKEYVDNEDDVLRFLREARAAAAVRHPNVVDVLDVARDDDGTPFIVQELLSGQDLEHHLAANGRKLSPVEALDIMLATTEAVAAAHARDVVHRDLKPANIFLAREGSRMTPKVLDFGACLFPTMGQASSKEKRMLIGTPHYMAPEQIAKKSDVDARTDVWALGVILYEVLVGENPFEAETAKDVMNLVKTKDVPRLRSVMRDAPEALEALVASCTARDMAKRFKSAEDLLSQMRSVREDLRKPAATGAAKAPNAAPRPAAIPRAPSLVMPRVQKPEVAQKPPSARNLLTLNVPGEDEDDAKPRVFPRSAPPAPPARPAAPAATSSPATTNVASRPPDDEDTSSLPPILDPRAKARAPVAPPAPPPPTLPEIDEVESFGEADLFSTTKPEPPPPPAARLAPPAPPPAPPAPVRPPAPSEPQLGAPPNRFSEPSLPNIELELDMQKAPARVSAPPPAHAAGPAPTNEAPKRVGPKFVPPPPATTSTASPSVSSLSTGVLAALAVAPALVAFVALSFLPQVTAPLGHALRGDSLVASGALSVIVLVIAGVLVVKSISGTRDRSLFVATGGALLFGIVMIIVTFMASEAAELGSPQSGIGPAVWVGPLAPLALAVACVRSARAAAAKRGEAATAKRYALLASVCLLVALEVSPVGAARSAGRKPPSGQASAH